MPHSPRPPEPIAIDPNYLSRHGYDPAFLGRGARRAPLPRLTARLAREMAVVEPGGRGQARYLLHYHHFSVAMHAARRLAVYTAVNVDGARWMAIPRERDAWYFDPRLPRALQAGPEIYTSNPLDRGHLVRRLDPAWGPSREAALAANDDTFHWTNCAPQHHDFNANAQRWAGLEDYLLENADREDIRVTVFTGPVFGESDREYRGIRLPAQFWKVAVIVKPGGALSATAYLVSQEDLVSRVGIVPFAYGAFRTYQVRVAQVEALTGLRFPSLRAHDPLEPPPGVAEEAVLPRPVGDYGDIRL